MEIGIISDTHGFLDPRVFEAFENCDEIWHAGDFGSLDVADQLKNFKPLRGVYGNIDSPDIRADYPEDQRFVIENVDVWITHIAGRPGRYSSRVLKGLKTDPPQVLICGHSHVISVENDTRFSPLKYINPGAAGHEGAHLMRTLIKAEFSDGEIKNMRLIELGARGKR